MLEDSVYCPNCSKHNIVKIPGKYECSDCGTKFNIRSNGSLKIYKMGEIKLSSILYNLFLLPGIFFIVLVSEHGVYLSFNKNDLQLIAFLLFLHPILFSIRESFSKSEEDDTIILELYLAFLRGKLKKFGTLNILYFYSSLFLSIFGFLLLFYTELFMRH